VRYCTGRAQRSRPAAYRHAQLLLKSNPRNVEPFFSEPERARHLPGGGAHICALVRWYLNRSRAGASCSHAQASFKRFSTRAHGGSSSSAGASSCSAGEPVRFCANSVLELADTHAVGQYFKFIRLTLDKARRLVAADGREPGETKHFKLFYQVRSPITSRRRVRYARCRVVTRAVRCMRAGLARCMRRWRRSCSTCGASWWTASLRAWWLTGQRGAQSWPCGPVPTRAKHQRAPRPTSCPLITKRPRPPCMWPAIASLSQRAACRSSSRVANAVGARGRARVRVRRVHTLDRLRADIASQDATALLDVLERDASELHLAWDRVVASLRASSDHHDAPQRAPDTHESWTPGAHLHGHADPAGHANGPAPPEGRGSPGPPAAHGRACVCQRSEVDASLLTDWLTALRVAGLDLPLMPDHEPTYPHDCEHERERVTEKPNCPDM
jgi:hypothetical protein